MNDEVEKCFSLMICLSPAVGPVLVAGGGAVGLRKVRTLLGAKMGVTLVSPEVIPELESLAEEKRILWKKRTVQRQDFQEHSFALLALPRKNMETVLPLADGTGCLLDCCGAPECGQWSLAAQFLSRNFIVGAASGGKDPAGSTALKKTLQRYLEEEKENQP